MADHERFERRAEAAFHPTSPPRHRTDLSSLLGIEGHDPIRIAPLSTVQGNGKRFDQRHKVDP